MRSLILLLLLFILLSSGIAKSQAPVIDTPQKLEELFDRLLVIIMTLKGYGSMIRSG
jgi:hypothetical protein